MQRQTQTQTHTQTDGQELKSLFMAGPSWVRQLDGVALVVPNPQCAYFPQWRINNQVLNDSDSHLFSDLLIINANDSDGDSNINLTLMMMIPMATND